MTSRIAEASVKKAVVTKLQQTAVKSSYEVKPGKYLVRRVVRESQGSQISAHSGFVAIPD